ncbi:hypothetical protein C8R43DRAFT_943463 [Mycena crocata]|nr:hypothetical protein C8R43DRAFT_943463 [Mycena crocata]
MYFSENPALESRPEQNYCPSQKELNLSRALPISSENLMINGYDQITGQIKHRGNTALLGPSPMCSRSFLRTGKNSEIELRRRLDQPTGSNVAYNDVTLEKGIEVAYMNGESSDTRDKKEDAETSVGAGILRPAREKGWATPTSVSSSTSSRSHVSSSENLRGAGNFDKNTSISGIPQTFSVTSTRCISVKRCYFSGAVKVEAIESALHDMDLRSENADNVVVTSIVVDGICVEFECGKDTGTRDAAEETVCSSENKDESGEVEKSYRVVQID